jgi:hypothetical protein
MEFNSRFASDVSDIFSRIESRHTIPRLGEHLTLDSNNVFRRSLIIEVNSDEVEVPVIARCQFENRVSEKIGYPNFLQDLRIILPLYDNSLRQERRTFDSIIRQLFSVPFGNRLQKVITNKGEVYYGGEGIIFNENYDPLLLCTLAARNIQTESGRNAMCYYRPICHISPKVFLEPDKLVNNGIIKKLIPFYTSRDVRFPSTYNDHFYINAENTKVKVIIDNFDKFFIEPIKPTPTTCSNDILNECLVENIEDIIMLL